MPDNYLENARRHLAAIARQRLGHDVSQDDMDTLLDFMNPVTYAPGDVIFRQNDPASAALFLADGRLRANIKTGDQEKVVGDSVPGEIVGEAALFRRGGRRTVTLTAVEPSTCLVLTRAVLVAAAVNPALIALELHLAHLCAERLAGRVDLIDKAWEACERVPSKFAGSLAKLVEGA